MTVVPDDVTLAGVRADSVESIQTWDASKDEWVTDEQEQDAGEGR